jgi:sec-independent protein translocase protein TatA
MTQEFQNILAFGMPGGWEWLIILAVAVLIFGRRLPEIARGVGKSVTEFKKGIKETQDDITDAVDSAGDDEVVSPNENLE